MAAYVRFISDNYYTRKRLVTKIQNYQPFCKHFYFIYEKALILSLSSLLIFNLTSCKEKANQDISIYLKGEEVAKIKDGKDKK